MAFPASYKIAVGRPEAPRKGKIRYFASGQCWFKWGYVYIFTGFVIKHIKKRVVHSCSIYVIINRQQIVRLQESGLYNHRSSVEYMSGEVRNLEETPKQKPYRIVRVFN